ncbi:phosphotransferase, partial [bacterium AH-315-E07]|nr:phosphotransferase [bacterium AH-315-E07]
KSGKKKPSSSSVGRRRTALVSACERILGARVAKFEYPGGRSRESWRVILDDGRALIATRRSTPQRAAIEANILRALNKHGAPVPALLNTDGNRILLQEELSGKRLSLALNDAVDEPAVEALLESALTGLVQSQLAGSAEGVEAKLPELGGRDSWIADLVERPVILSNHFDLPVPDYDKEALVSLLRITQPRFVKWDSRPGNALVNASGVVHWFDWEHSGVRNRLDDLAWLLCDEYVPDITVVENSLLKQFLPKFSDTRSQADAMDYLMAYGVFHSVVRLGLILKNKGDEEWWDLDYCIDRDKIGITLHCAQRVCARGARWASKVSATEALAPWFMSVSARIAAL